MNTVTNLTTSILYMRLRIIIGWVFIFLVGFYGPLQSQTKSLRHISFFGGIVLDNDNIIVTGTRSSGTKYGSISTITYLNSDLEQQWVYQLDDKISNLIDRVAVFEDKIIITGMQGEVQDRHKDTRRFVTILDKNGELIKKQILGTCQFLDSTPFVKKDNEVIFCVNRDTTMMRIVRGEQLDINLVTIDLNQNTIQETDINLSGNFNAGGPAEIVQIDNASYLLGQTDKGYDTFCFLKKLNDDNDPPEKMIFTDLLTQFDLKIGQGNSSQLLHNVFNYADGWQGYFMSPKDMLQADSLNYSKPAIKFKLSPHDIFTHGEHIFFLEDTESYKSCNLVMTDLAGNIVSKEPLDFIPKKIVADDKYFYFLENYSGTQLIRKLREN